MGSRRYGPDTNEEVMEEASKGLFKGVKLTIEYACNVNSLDVPHILDELRSYGSAKIIKAEPLSAEQLRSEGLS